MKKSNEYSAQELAVMSWEELAANSRLWQAEGPSEPAAAPAVESSSLPVEPEVLRAIGGL